MLTEEERVNRREEFLLRFGGAMMGGLEDAVMEAYFKANMSKVAGKFPYMRPHENLPPYDDIIVGGLAIPPWVIGALMEEDGKKKGDTKAEKLGKNVKMFGGGDAIYAFNMLIHHTIGATGKMLMPTAARIPVSRRSRAAQPGQRTDVAHRIIKL